MQEAPVEQKELGSRELTYVFEKDILVVEDAIQFGPELIQCAERVDLWKRSSVANKEDGEYYDSKRNNDSVLVKGAEHPDFLPFEEQLCHVFHGVAHAYRALNPHLNVKRDTEFQLLRYQPGQHFDLHIDNIARHGSWGMRQLSAVGFLNADVEGGTLTFPRQDMKIEPRAGRLVMWPSSFCFPHASEDVVKGVKYSVVTWFV